MDHKLLTEIKDSMAPVYPDVPPPKPTAAWKIVAVTALVVASALVGVGYIFYVWAAPDAITEMEKVKKNG